MKNLKMLGFSSAIDESCDSMISKVLDGESPELILKEFTASSAIASAGAGSPPLGTKKKKKTKKKTDGGS